MLLLCVVHSPILKCSFLCENLLWLSWLQLRLGAVVVLPNSSHFQKKEIELRARWWDQSLVTQHSFPMLQPLGQNCTPTSIVPAPTNSLRWFPCVSHCLAWCLRTHLRAAASKMQEWSGNVYSIWLIASHRFQDVRWISIIFSPYNTFTFDLRSDYFTASELACKPFMQWHRVERHLKGELGLRPKTSKNVHFSSHGAKIPQTHVTLYAYFK